MGLLDEISKLTNPVSELPDLEDDNLEGSKTLKSTGKARANFDFEQGKYAGTAVSRKSLFGDISEISGLHNKNADDSEEYDDEDEQEDEEEVEEEDDVDSEASDASENGKIGESDEGEVDDEEVVEDEDDEGDSGETKLKMTTLSLNDDSDKADKAASVRGQRQVWDDLMYGNIRVHALLNSVNQMPRGDARKSLLKSSDVKTKESLMNALANMAKLRNSIQKATNYFGKNGSGQGENEDDDDEEIPSDDDEEIPSDDEGMDDEEEGDSGDDSEDVTPSESVGTSLKALKSNLGKKDEGIDKFRATTITKWYNRTKLISQKSMNNTDFSVFEKGSILGQIQKVIADEEKLLKKVRTNRSGRVRIGASPSEAIDNEVFDDSDFYQILLKQMLESRSQSTAQDGADMTRSYMELQSMFQSKKKRDVSQLSSKDRRLKYEPIAKLVNFYPSKPSVVTWSHESRNELFKSLFS
ncbi:unnamed protein product [Caenorhabditis sp. 36 PRJEB53466]|nr:unnamed protein product [Caenorhabditis sp. 36 PRJEB53466]